MTHDCINYTRPWRQQEIYDRNTSALIYANDVAQKVTHTPCGTVRPCALAAYKHLALNLCAYAYAVGLLACLQMCICLHAYHKFMSKANSYTHTHTHSPSCLTACAPVAASQQAECERSQQVGLVVCSCAVKSLTSSTTPATPRA